MTIEEAAREWALIDTAPKDGTDVLLARHDADGSYRVVVGQWVERWDFFESKDDPILLWFEPTHWRPLPAAQPMKGACR